MAATRGSRDAPIHIHRQRSLHVSGGHPEEENTARGSLIHVPKSLLGASDASVWHALQLVLASFGGSATTVTPSHPLRPVSAWHAKLPWIAVADAEDRVQVLQATARPAMAGQPGDPPDYILAHELQVNVCSLAWRPRSRCSLAVGCNGNVVLWDCERGPSGALSTKAGSRDGSAMWVLALPTRGGGTVSCMQWSPCGQWLAVGVHGVPGLQVWDVAAMRYVAVQHGLDEVNVLAWSPCGGYLLASSGDNGFMVWETATWQMRTWFTAAGSRLTSACWAPDSSCCILAFSPLSQAAVLYFTSPHPSLEAQFLPLQLQGYVPGDASVLACAWDPTGQRMVLGVMQPLTDDGPKVPHAIVFSTTFRPVLHALHLGTQPLRAPQSQGGSNLEETGPPLLSFAASVPPQFGGPAGALLGVAHRLGDPVAMLPLPMTAKH